MPTRNNKHAVRLKELRIALCKSKSRFAMELGTRLDRYRKYETGEAVIPPEIAKRLYKAYHVNLLWFFTGEGGKFLPILEEETLPSFPEYINHKVYDLLKCMKAQPDFLRDVFTLFRNYIAANAQCK